jgi:hypothetical protein
MLLLAWQKIVCFGQQAYFRQNVLDNVDIILFFVNNNILFLLNIKMFDFLCEW